MNITIFSKATGKGVQIQRYDRANGETREYRQPTAASLSRICAVIQQLKAYHSDNPPHWTSYTLIKDCERRKHFTMLNSLLKRVGLKWEINRDLYLEFLGILPPLDYRNDGSFYMREFCSGRMTTRYTIENGRYYCEFANYPPQEGAR